MNGARTTFMRRGYLLTALAAAVLLAASVGTAEAQRVSIGFVGASGTVSESAFLDANSLSEPRTITVRVQGLLGGTSRAGGRRQEPRRGHNHAECECAYRHGWLRRRIRKPGNCKLRCAVPSVVYSRRGWWNLPIRCQR